MKEKNNKLKVIHVKWCREFKVEHYFVNRFIVLKKHQQIEIRPPCSIYNYSFQILRLLNLFPQKMISAHYN